MGKSVVELVVESLSCLALLTVTARFLFLFKERCRCIFVRLLEGDPFECCSDSMTMAPRSLLAVALLSTFLLVNPGEAATAAQKVSSVSNAGVPLFENEQMQLTDHALSNLHQNHSALFAFGKNESSLSTRSRGECKVFPGDRWWPSHFVWSLFDEFSGGALIKTVPLAASCYSSWPEYDSNECSTITSEWTNSYLQYVLKRTTQEISPLTFIQRR